MNVETMTVQEIVSELRQLEEYIDSIRDTYTPAMRDGLLSKSVRYAALKAELENRGVKP